MLRLRQSHGRGARTVGGTAQLPAGLAGRFPDIPARCRTTRHPHGRPHAATSPDEIEIGGTGFRRPLFVFGGGVTEGGPVADDRAVEARAFPKSMRPDYHRHPP